MQTKHLFVLTYIWTKGEVGAPLNRLSPPVIYFNWPFQGGASFVDHLCYFCLVLLCFHARLFIAALWSPVGKGLTSWLSFVMSYCDVVTFPLVSWVRCGAWLYRFLIICPLSYFESEIKKKVTTCRNKCIKITLALCRMYIHVVTLTRCLSLFICW